MDKLNKLVEEFIKENYSATKKVIGIKEHFETFLRVEVEMFELPVQMVEVSMFDLMLHLSDKVNKIEKRPKPILSVVLPGWIPEEQYREIRDELSKSLKDEYYILLSPTSGKDIKLEVMNCSDIDEINFEELKSIIRKENKK